MTPKQFYEFMTNVDSGVISLESEIRLKIGRQDAIAARLLLWLVDEMPDDATQGELDDVLDAAKWWATFWAAMYKEDA